jgi:F-type H+-transporting ATPase subunit gamma
MPSLKTIRKRLVSVKSTQKITRAMKMVAGARLTRAQQRALSLRPYAEKTQEVLGRVVREINLEDDSKPVHPLLVKREDQHTLYLVLSGDRGLCGAFNSNINRTAERLWKTAEEEGRSAHFYVIGRKARDYLRRRNAPIDHVFTNVWEQLNLEEAREIAKTILGPFQRGEITSIKILYTKFKSAMTQEVELNSLLPLDPSQLAIPESKDASSRAEVLFEPSQEALLDRLVPMYIEVSILRALFESQASELGARMTAMDSATKNAKDMITRLTLQYNRARQAAITKELMEIIGGAEALKDS